MEGLARRAVACPGWRWMPGMLRDDGYRFIGLDPTNGEEHGFAAPPPAHRVEYLWPSHMVEAVVLPDLDDPCTLGGLLALVREAWGDPWIRVEPMSREWRTLHSRPAPFCAGPTEAAALVAALETAP